jgi:hypothetical protein
VLGKPETAALLLVDDRPPEIRVIVETFEQHVGVFRHESVGQDDTGKMGGGLGQELH